jgi:two-component system nitrogen regulation sensor histidine kinase NtrY
MSVDHAVNSDPAIGLSSGASSATPREVRIVGPIVVGIALLSALITFLVLADLTPVPPTHNVVVTLLLVNVATVVSLLAIIAREVWQVVQAQRKGRAAARLHVRIVSLFSIIAAAPAILVAIVASVTLDRGLDRLFSTRTRSAIENSVIVADAYLREHAQITRSDIIVLAFEVSRAKELYDKDRERMNQLLTLQANVRGLAAAIVLGDDLSVQARASTPVTETFSTPSREQLATVTENEPQIVLLPDASYVAGAIKLRGYDNKYLYIARLMDPRVIAQLRDTQATASEYAVIETRRLGVQVAFALMYTVIALIVLLSAVWIGLNFANRLVAPIRRLIGAANVVSTGNLYVQVPIRKSEGDLAQLGETFNRMTQELRAQRNDIVRARDTIDSRRRFTEAVLSGASAGVIGVDADGRVSIMNRSAEKLVGSSEADALGQPLAQVVPELAQIMVSAQSGGRVEQDQVTLSRGGRERNLSVRVTGEQSGEADHGYVITLDDMTELVSAQRTSAWADIARRIAHEIKNPLTPIQLSAERLRRKYGKSITDDPAVFQQCTDTIVRQVDDIRRMVDEFSKFARMPKPVIGNEDVADTARQAVFLMKVAHPEIDFDVELAEDPMPARFDRRLISQALTNIIKNATEAIAARTAGTGERGRIRVAATRDDSDIVIDIVDNGIGLPKQGRNRLLEPYVTTREKGTGLGLAIVGRILEEHGGSIELRDASEKIPGAHGAWMTLRFSESGDAPVKQTTDDHPGSTNG